MVCTRRAGGVGLNYPNLRAVFVLDIPTNQFGPVPDALVSCVFAPVACGGSQTVLFCVISDSQDPDVYTQQVGRIRGPGVAVNVVKTPEDLVKANQVWHPCLMCDEGVATRCWVVDRFLLS
jgi:hypothetical protein